MNKKIDNFKLKTTLVNMFFKNNSHKKLINKTMNEELEKLTINELLEFIEFFFFEIQNTLEEQFSDKVFLMKNKSLAKDYFDNLNSKSFSIEKDFEIYCKLKNSNNLENDVKRLIDFYNFYLEIKNYKNQKDIKKIPTFSKYTLYSNNKKKLKKPYNIQALGLVISFSLIMFLLSFLDIDLGNGIILPE